MLLHSLDYNSKGGDAQLIKTVYLREGHGKHYSNVEDVWKVNFQWCDTDKTDNNRCILQVKPFISIWDNGPFQDHPSKWNYLEVARGRACLIEARLKSHLLLFIFPPLLYICHSLFCHIYAWTQWAILFSYIQEIGKIRIIKKRSLLPKFRN